MENRTKSNRRKWAERLGLITGLVLLFVVALLWGLRGVTPAHADPGDLYVDGASGQDIPTCGTTITPCQTISYILNSRASGGDTIRVAQGVYTENLTINISATLEGGYESVGWTRNITQYETIIDGSGTSVVPGDWDGDRVRYPAVITDGGTYKMWYVGIDLYGAGRIGYATSPDGVNWTKHASNPVLDMGANGEWDSQELEAPFVIKEGPTSYKMWYAGRGPDDSWRIGYATSTDGINWTKCAGNPVLDLDTDTWNNVSVHGPSILYEDSLYKMWLHTVGDDGSGPAPYTAYATSPNGITWTLAITNPLFSRDPAHYWESNWIWGPSVLHIGSDYQMWYSASGSGGGRTGYATSPDETTWTKYNGGADSVLSGTGGEWDEGRAVDPYVLYANGVYTMYYDNNTSIGVATSTNGITWTKSLSNPVLTSGTPSQWGEPVVRFEAGSDGAVLDGFMVMGGDALQGGGVLVYDAEVTIQNCTVDANRAWDAGAGIGVANSADVTIHNTRVTNNVRWGGGGGGAGLWVDGSTVTVTDSIFQHNEATHHPGGGIGLWVNASMNATNIIVVDNTNGGIYLTMGSTADLVNATIANNTGIGIDVASEDSTANLVNNILALNGDGDLNCEDACTVSYSDIGEALWPGPGNISANPWFADPANGDYHLQAWSPCIDAGTANGAPDHDFEGDPRPQNEGYDMGADEFVGTPIPFGPLYVDGATGSDTTDCTNPTAPCKTIGYALTQAGNGDEISVAAGTYTETLDVFGNPLTLRGGYTVSGTVWLPRTGETVVDANGADNPVICIGSGANVTVEGFTVQGANHTSDWGGGFSINGATVVISDTVVRDNSTGGSGGGAFIENTVGAENMSVSLINSTFVGNVADGGTAGLVVGGWGEPFQVTIENTVFTGNTGGDVLNLGHVFEIVGGQVSSNTVTGDDYAITIHDSGSGTISGTEIMSNTSGAMDICSVVSAHNLTVRGNTGGGIVNHGVLTLTHSVIENNSGGDRSLIDSGNEAAPETTRLVVDGCTIQGNSTPQIVRITTGYAEIRSTKIVDNGPTGDVIDIGEGDTTPTVEMVNVLLADNETQGHDAVVHHVTGSAMLMNVTVVGNNTNDQTILFTHSAMTVANIILWGNTTSAEDMLGGPGTFSVTYSDIEGGWTGTGNLDADPKFVDATSGDYRLGVGSPCIDKGTSAGAPTHDIEGTPRDAAPDMGAYEWTGFRIFLPLTLRNFES